MCNLSSNVLFFALILLNFFPPYESIVLQKKASSIVLSRSIIQYSQEKKLALAEIKSKTSYLYTTYVNYIFPDAVQDCSIYESLLPLFKKSYTEVENAVNMVVPTYSNTNMDRVSGVAFIYLSFEDNNLILSSEKTKILENLNKSIDNLTDIIQNDKCNFDAKWKTNSNKYFCTPNPGHITATGGLNDTCAKFKMFYAPYNGEKAYCFQSLNTGKYCTSEKAPLKDRPFTCNRPWCRSWEQFRTNNTRSSQTYTFKSVWDTYLTTDSEGDMYANNENEEKFTPIFI